MDTNVITISRQFGSLGRPIAKKAAEYLGYKYYDRFIVEEIAKEMNHPVGDLLNFDEKDQLSVYDRMVSPLGIGPAAQKRRLFEIEKNIIIDLAKKDDCVIVEHCSDYILRSQGIKNLFNIYIYAPYSDRYNYSMRELGLTEKAVENYINQVDRARDDFYRLITGEHFYSLKYRDMAINSAQMPIDDIVKSICSTAELKFKL